MKQQLSLWQLVLADIRAKAQWVYGETTRAAILKTICTDGTFAMLMYRFMQASQRKRLVPLAMLFNKLNVVFGRCIIGRGARFGPGFVLIHSYGVVVNSSVAGGCNVRLEHLVTIGAERDASPTLGDNVFIGAGAKVIGGVRIGSNVKVGANAVVTKDVPDNCTAVGVPARVLPKPGGNA